MSKAIFEEGKLCLRNDTGSFFKFILFRDAYTNLFQIKTLLNQSIEKGMGCEHNNDKVHKATSSFWETINMTINNNPSAQGLSGVSGREATREEIARRDGYVQGRNDENYAQGALRTQERMIAQERANDSAASGMLVGLLIALLAAGAGAALYFFTGDRTNVVPVAVPQVEKETTKETTIIEREVQAPEVSLPDVQVDVPEVNLPDVDINEASEPVAEPEAKSEPEPAATEPEI